MGKYGLGKESPFCLDEFIGLLFYSVRFVDICPLGLPMVSCYDGKGNYFQSLSLNSIVNKIIDFILRSAMLMLYLG